jgi:hypothetical protein
VELRLNLPEAKKSNRHHAQIGKAERQNILGATETESETIETICEQKKKDRGRNKPTSISTITRWVICRRKLVYIEDCFGNEIMNT